MASFLVQLSRAADTLILAAMVFFAVLVMAGLDEGLPVPPQFQCFSAKPMVPVMPFSEANLDSIPTLLRPVGPGMSLYCNVACCLAEVALLALCFRVKNSSGLSVSKKMELTNLIFFWAMGGFGVIWDFKNLVDEQHAQEGWTALFFFVGMFHVGYECVIAPCIMLRAFPSGRSMMAGISISAVVLVLIIQSGLISLTRATMAFSVVTFTAHSCGKLAISTLNMESRGNQLALLMWWGHAAPELLSCIFECSLFLEVTLHFFVVAPALYSYVCSATDKPQDTRLPDVGCSRLVKSNTLADSRL